MTRDWDREPNANGTLVLALAYLVVFTVIGIYSFRILALAAAAMPPLVGGGMVGVPGLQIMFCTQAPRAHADCASLAIAARDRMGFVQAGRSNG